MPRMPLPAASSRRASGSSRASSPTPSWPASSRRADLVTLPYREIDQSGVLYAALGLGRPLLLSAVGGFPEVAATGAAELVAPDDPAALHAALRGAARRPRPPRGAGRRGGRAAAATTYAWDAHRASSTSRCTACCCARETRDLLDHARRCWRGRRSGYGARAGAAAPARPPGLRAGCDADAALPTVSLIIAAHAERDVIAAKVANALALDYPREQLEIVVACDGSTDGTPDAGARRRRRRRPRPPARRQGPRPGRRGPPRDAPTSSRSPTPTRSGSPARCARSSRRSPTDARIGYVCGRVTFVNPDGGTNQEGVYWRYEMFLRARESDLASVTAGNGAIYATRRDAYVEVDPVMGHDLKFPFTLVRAGWRCVYAAARRARPSGWSPTSRARPRASAG